MFQLSADITTRIEWNRKDWTTFPKPCDITPGKSKRISTLPWYIKTARRKEVVKEEAVKEDRRRVAKQNRIIGGDISTYH